MTAKSWIVERVEAVIARQRDGKSVPQQQINTQQ
jgi:hypothetical protein